MISISLTPSGNNWVEVGLEKFDEKHVREFREHVMDSPNIRFVQGKCIIDV